MKKLKLNIEQLTDLWWVLDEITRGKDRSEYKSLFALLNKITEARESYRVPFPKDPELDGFIAACREIQKDKESDERKAKIRGLKEVNQKHVDTLKEFYKEFRKKEAISTHLEYEPLLESDLPSDITQQQLTALRQLLPN
jgi:hypothetical protein